MVPRRPTLKLPGELDVLLPSLNLPSLASPSALHVHFPPTPEIVSEMYETWSPTSYDRAPIVVSPNACELPQRGERAYYTPIVGRSNNGAHAFFLQSSTYDGYATLSPPPANTMPCSAPFDQLSFMMNGPTSPLLPHILVVPASGQPHAEESSSGATIIQRSRSLDHLQSALTLLSTRGAAGGRHDNLRQQPVARQLVLLSSNSGGPHVTYQSDPERSFASPSLDGCLGGF